MAIYSSCGNCLMTNEGKYCTSVRENAYMKLKKHKWLSILFVAVVVFFFINCFITFMQLCHWQHSTQVCVQCVLAEVAANSQTSFSSHESVPYRAVQVHLMSCPTLTCWHSWSHRRLHSVRGGETLKTDHHVVFLSASEEGNCSETQRFVSAKVMTLVFHYSLQLSNKWED